MTTKKTGTQLDREIAEALAHHRTNGGGATRDVTDPPGKIRATKGLKLTENQKTMLRMAADTGRMSSGRYGWNEMHVRALEKKGLVRLASKATWDKEWKLTDQGRELAKTLHAGWVAEQTK